MSALKQGSADTTYLYEFQLAQTYMQLLTTAPIMEGTSERLGYDVHAGQIKTQQAQNTQIMVITVEDSGTLSDITVDLDITHTFIGDLTVTLTSPAGTVVTLHNGTGSNSDDILGNYPGSLAVDGPGDLADFQGESIQGDWTLFVVDDASSDSGTLNVWGIHLQVPVIPTSVGDQVPMVTRLAGNAPNPFNPQTVIAYDLARTGPVRLDIFDLRGRLVRRLVDESVAAGRHQVRWDGRDGGGREMASGVYLCRLHAGSAPQLHKMTLVR